jgi:hypothetical protein
VSDYTRLPVVLLVEDESRFGRINHDVFSALTCHLAAACLGMGMRCLIFAILKSDWH